MEYKYRFVNIKNWILGLTGVTLSIVLFTVLRFMLASTSTNDSGLYVYSYKSSIGDPSVLIQFKNSIELPSLPISPQNEDLTFGARICAPQSSPFGVILYFLTSVSTLLVCRLVAYTLVVPVYLRYCQLLL